MNKRKSEVEQALDIAVASLEKGALDKIIKSLEKDRIFAEDTRSTPTLPSHSIALDVALGGGWPRGVIIVVAGDNDQGKSTLLRETIARNLRDGVGVLDQDYEGKMDPQRRFYLLGRYGVDIEKVMNKKLSKRLYYFHVPLNAEEGKRTAVLLGSTGRVGIFVADSVPSIRSKAHVNAVVDEKSLQAGMHAKTIGNFVEDVKQVMRKTQVVQFYVNQQRQAIGKWAPFGVVPTYLPGGEHLKYLTTVRLFVKKERLSKDKGWDEGWNVVLRFVKNHVNSGFRGEIRLRYDATGVFCWEEEALQFGMNQGFIKKTFVKAGNNKKQAFELVGKEREPLVKEDVLQWIHEHTKFVDLVRAEALKLPDDTTKTASDT